MLVDHPDPRADRVSRGGELDALAVQQQLARVGPVEPVEDVHQRRLSGAVLTEQRVHLATADVEIDVIVGDGPRELFPDPAHLEYELLGHRGAS